MEYNKPSLSITDQIQKLKIRGLVVDDENYAKHWLEHVSYYRLSAYYIPFEILDPSSARTHQFKRDSFFSDIIALYIFDRKLRLLTIEALERIEISIRSHWVNELTQKYGSHAHITHEPFKCPWTHLNDLTRASIPLKEQNKETFVEHYRKKYTQPFLPPPLDYSRNIISWGFISLDKKHQRYSYKKTDCTSGRVANSRITRGNITLFNSN